MGRLPRVVKIPLWAFVRFHLAVRSRIRRSMAFRPYRSSRLAPRKKARRNEQAHSYDEGDYLYDETPRCRMGTFSPVARHAIINAAYQAQEFQHARYLENLRASILKLGSNDDSTWGVRWGWR